MGVVTEVEIHKKRELHKGDSKTNKLDRQTLGKGLIG